VEFDQPLNSKILAKAVNASEKADITLVMGTSMRVSPASELPGLGKQMFLCNLQKTPADGEAHSLIRGRTDDVIALLCKLLNVTIPNLTPFGNQVQWTDEIDSVHERKMKEFKQKREIQKEQLSASSSPSS